MTQSTLTTPRRTLKVTLLTIGLRGDVQPYCALGMGLKRAGHEVKIATNSNFELFVRQCDLEFVALAPDFQEQLQSQQGQQLIGGEKVQLVSDELCVEQLNSAWAASLLWN